MLIVWLFKYIIFSLSITAIITFLFLIFFLIISLSFLLKCKESKDRKHLLSCFLSIFLIYNWYTIYIKDLIINYLTASCV